LGLSPAGFTCDNAFMLERRCPYCRKNFYPSKCQREQIVCGESGCQAHRRADYRRKKIAADPSYLEACRQSARQWRKQHPDYWSAYRKAHPAGVARNRERQKARDRRQHLANLANNISASDLKLCAAKVWVLGSELHDLANNTSAPAQVWVLEALSPTGEAGIRLANNTALAP
jgi:hypothetical protein